MGVCRVLWITAGRHLGVGVADGDLGGLGASGVAGGRTLGFGGIAGGAPWDAAVETVGGGLVGGGAAMVMEERMGAWARWNVLIGVGGGGAAAALDLLQRGEQGASLVFFMTSLLVMLELQYFTIWAAIAVAVGWPGVIYWFGLHPGYWLVVVLAAPAIWLAWRCRGMALGERARVAGLADPGNLRMRFWGNAGELKHRTDCAREAMWATLGIAFLFAVGQALGGDWRVAVVLGLALCWIADGFRQRALWTVGAAAVVVPLALWLSRDWLLPFCIAMSYLPPGLWAIWAERKRPAEGN
jgi:hypothetical protein